MGKFNTHGGVFAPLGYMRINAGGSHEENPNGGVKVGVDGYGTPNMLEENEPVYKDFVFSDNIEASEDILKQFNIPTSYKGKLYSQIADAFVDEAEERPNDPISNNGLNAMLVRLAGAQEEQKRIAEQKELEKELAAMTPEELEQLETLLAAQDEKQASADYAMLERDAQQDVQMMKCGGKMNKFYPGGIMDNISDNDKRQRIAAARQDARLKADYAWDLADSPSDYARALKLWWDSKTTIPDEVLSDEEKTRIIITGTPPLPTPVGKGFQLSENTLKRAREMARLRDAEKGLLYKLSGSKLGRLISGEGKAARVIEKASDATPSNGAGAKILKKSWIPLVTGGGIWGGKVILDNEAPKWEHRRSVNNMGFAPTDSVYEEEPVIDWLNYKAAGGPLSVAPRYAGAITSGILGVYDAFQQPDRYTIPTINPLMSTTRLKTVDPRYVPMDVNTLSNQVLSSGANTIRALRNAGLGAGTGAAIIAADNNITRGLGDAFARTADISDQRYNTYLGLLNANRQAEAAVDQARQQYNGQMRFNADRYNAQNRLYEQIYNYNAEGQKYAALQSQIDQIAQALAGIGRENFVINQVNGDDAYDYLMSLSGDTVHKKRCGGFMKTYKR